MSALPRTRAWACLWPAAKALLVSCLQPSGHSHGRDDHAGHQAATVTLIPGPISHWPGQHRDLFVGAQAPPGRQLRHSLGAAQQDPARND